MSKEVVFVKASDITPKALDTTGRCTTYPECGHTGFPDCCDLNGLLLRADTGWYLTSEGFSTKGTYVSIKEVQLAAEWLKHSRGRCSYMSPICESEDGTKYDTHYKGKTRWINSYALKHVVEHDMHSYISNGAIIAAALLLDVSWKDKYGPNIMLRVKVQKNANTV